MTREQAVYKIGPVIVDEDKGRISYGANSARVPPRCLAMLRALNEQRDKFFSEESLRKRIPRRKGDGASLRSIKSLLNNALRRLKLPDSLPYIIDGSSRSGYRLALTSPQIANIEVLEAPTRVVTPTSPPDKFSFLIDGMILDVVGELLMHDKSMFRIMNAGRGTYQRCLEDFAFSVVYASSITSATDIVNISKNPTRISRAEIVSQLGSIWRFHDLAPDLKRGRILETGTYRELVRKDVEAAGRCILKTEWAFRDWLSGEVPRHLGDDDTLFEANLPSDRVVFGVDDTLSHYRDPDLQAALGEEATRLATSFLRDATRNSKRRPSTSALREFGTASIVGLVTVMRESDISAERSHIWRMPHLLRCLVKQQVLFDSSVQQQIHLKRIVTQHAMAAALHHVDGIERRSVITALIDLRKVPPFKDIRQILEEHNLRLSQPRSEDDPKARLIIEEIIRLSHNPQAISESFTLAQGAALRALAKPDSDQYKTKLSNVFPALGPM